MNGNGKKQREDASNYNLSWRVSAFSYAIPRLWPRIDPPRNGPATREYGVPMSRGFRAGEEQEQHRFY
jgi:hypothetical protein